MLDSVLWRVFEKTGNIDAYLLYVDIKNINAIGKDEHRIEGTADNTVQVN